MGTRSFHRWSGAARQSGHPVVYSCGHLAFTNMVVRFFGYRTDAPKSRVFGAVKPARAFRAEAGGSPRPTSVLAALALTVRWGTFPLNGVQSSSSRPQGHGGGSLSERRMLSIHESVLSQNCSASCHGESSGQR